MGLKTAHALKTHAVSPPSYISEHDELRQDGGPWFVKQSFLRAESVWLSLLLGAYFPSLPRVLEILNDGTQTNVVLGSGPGEEVQNYCNRLGSLPVGIACLLVWRLATEFEALESFLPEAVSFLDPLSCKVGLWQQDFLHLFVDRFVSRPHRREETATRMLRLCSILISGQSAMEINAAAAARVPSTLLVHFRELQYTGRTSLTLGGIKGALLIATAAVTRELRGSNMMSQLIANERWHPLLPEAKSTTYFYGSTEKSRLPFTSVRLSRLLAHRNRLTQSELLLLQYRLRQQASSVPVLDLVLDPERIHLRLPGIRDNNIKMLDIRLDSLSEFSIALESASGCLSLGRSPIAIREAVAPGSPFSDLRGDTDAQCSRLWQTLQDATYSLSGYNSESSQGRELPGMFFCSLASPLSHGGKSMVGQAKSAEYGASLSHHSPTLHDKALLKAPNESSSSESILQSAEVSTFNTTLRVQSQRPMKMILITAGSGGTGKSTISRLIYELAGFEAREDVAMFDCDALGNRDFHKISPEKIVSMPIDNVDSMRRIVETAMEGKLVLADLPASCQDILARDLNPGIIQSLRMDEGLHWLPIHPVTAKAATLPAIKQWRTSIFGDAPSIIIVCMKDGPISSEDLDEIVRPQDMVLRMPVIDHSLAAALDASNASWLDILEGRVTDCHRMFCNPLVKRQLRFKRKECEDALFPLLRRIIKDPISAN
jgi:hypothetical protein